MAGYYTAPAPNITGAVVDTSTIFPLSITFQDMAMRKTWDTSHVVTAPGDSLYYVLGMKAISLYNATDKHIYLGLRIIRRFAQCSLISCLLLLNTYWCHHVEALVDEGHFMSKGEMYTYWVLAATVLILPPGVYIILGNVLNDWDRASKVADLFMLILGLTVILGYGLTCHRLRTLERDSRNVTGEDTSTTLQLVYYIQCVYWLTGSMIAILILGVLYQLPLVKCEVYPVLAQAMNDLQGALWSTLVILIYPAAMFLLYPSVDVLTKPQNDPGSKFQKRIRKSVKDAQRIRASLYLDGDSGSGIHGSGGSHHGANHSSLYGLTSHPVLSSEIESGQQQQQPSQQQQEGQQQQRHYYEPPKKRDRMESITAVMGELKLPSKDPMESQMDADEDQGTGTSMEMTRTGSTDRRHQQDRERAESHWVPSHGQPDKATRAKPSSTLAVSEKSRRDSGSPSNYYEDSRDVEVMKQWIAQHDDVDRAGLIAGLEQTILPSDQLPLQLHNSQTSSPPSSTTTRSSPTSTLTGGNKSPASKSPAAAVVPLAGILKSRNSTSSARSSVGQNPFDRPAFGGPTPAYGVRTSSMPGMHGTPVGRGSSDYGSPVRRRSSGSKATSTASAVAAAMVSATNSPSSASESPSPSLSNTQQPQRRSNVTARVDASALAIAAAQQQQQQNYRLENLNAPTAPAPRTSRDGAIEMDYFGLRKFSFEESNSSSTPTSPMPLPYEPTQLVGNQLHPEVMLSPTLTGFLMADPYPSAGTPYISGGGSGSGSDSEQDTPSSISMSEDDDSRRSGNVSAASSIGTAKRYRAPPPPIPTLPARAPLDFDSQGMAPLTPTTPTTPPGVRPRRSVDTVVDRQFLEMANRMYEDVVPAHLLPQTAVPSNSLSSPTTTKTETTVSGSTPNVPSPTAIESPVSTATRSLIPSSIVSENASVPTSVTTSPSPQISYRDVSGSSSSLSNAQRTTMQQQQSFLPTMPSATTPTAGYAVTVPRPYGPASPSPRQHFTQFSATQPTIPGSQQDFIDRGGVMIPPIKSPYRVRESFETRTTGQGIGAASSSPPTNFAVLAQGRANSPSPASTASPTMTPTSTLPRPLTPAWYESKTNFASTNDVLTHYNAVMRAGSYRRQQQQQQTQQAQRPYITQPSIGPLDDVSSQYQMPPHPFQQSPQQPFPLVPLATVDQQQESLNKPSSMDYLQEDVSAPDSRPSSLQPRVGSTDSFGVVRRRRSSVGRKEDAAAAAMISSGLSSEEGLDSRDRQHILSSLDQHHHLQRERQSSPKESMGQLDRHSFMLQPPQQQINPPGSESISVYSTWTGELSDVTTTSGEVSIGAFVDRKKATSHQYQRRKSSLSTGESSASSPGQSNSHIPGTTSSNKHASTLSNSTGAFSSGTVIVPGRFSNSGGLGVDDVRKSQASAYSMGSSFGANGSSHSGSSGGGSGGGSGGSRQSAGAYSTYSLYSTSTGFGSGPVVVSASLSSVGVAASTAPTANSSPALTITAVPSTSSATRRQSGGNSSKGRVSGGGSALAADPRSGYDQDPDMEVERVHRRSLDRALLSEGQAIAAQVSAPASTTTTTTRAMAASNSATVAATATTENRSAASLTVLGPSQYRITTTATTSPGQSPLIRNSGLPGSAATVSGPSYQQHLQQHGSSSSTTSSSNNINNNHRSQSPYKRTSSRLTNLTNPESEYQWESAELNQQQWEMLE
ncbi:hypothetical protein BGZ83_009585 [Gryganskiella cystojenkinii]|nr:hypothetical protein BGZ83_009585 [Gryganskiella cystojenkinii]